MAEYLGRPLPEQKYKDISEACSFKNLKYASETIKDQTYHYKWQDGSSGYFRKGNSNSVDLKLNTDPPEVMTLRKTNVFLMHQNEICL